MKSREPRRKVVIGARIRVAESWGDALILNMSSRGLLIQSNQPPKRGSYVELRRGRYVIIARAVWAGDGRFGVQTQDVIPIEAVLREPDRSSGPPIASSPPEERRVAVREAGRNSAKRHEDSRIAARILEFSCFIFIGAMAASLVFFAVADALANPLHAVTAALD